MVTLTIQFCPKDHLEFSEPKKRSDNLKNGKEKQKQTNKQTTKTQTSRSCKVTIVYTKKCGKNQHRNYYKYW